MKTQNQPYSNFQIHQMCAEFDIEQLVTLAFSWHFSLSGVPAEVDDIATLRLQLLFNNQDPTLLDPLLKGILTRHLEIGKVFSQLWVDPDPDIEQLLEAYDRQTQAMERWEIFLQMLHLLKEPTDLESVQRACDFAFVRYTPQPLLFGSPAEQATWMTGLKNEQQRDFLEMNKMEASSTNLPNENILYHLGEQRRLKPSLANILAAVEDGLPHTMTELIQKTLATNIISKDKRKLLSRKIYDLNQILLECWGPAQSGRWIDNHPHPKDWAYKLNRPS